MEIKERSEVVKHFIVMSDLHITKNSLGEHKNTKVNYTNFENEFLQFISQEFDSKDKSLDFIIVAGDLTDKNNEDGYISLSSTLESIVKSNVGLVKDNIICCPGNHDLDRDQIESTLDLIIKAEPSTKAKKSRNQLREALLNYLSTATEEKAYEAIENIHNKKFANYNSFLDGLYADTSKDYDIRKKPGYTINLDGIEFTSINSSWFCAFPDQRQSDEGNLILGINYIKKSMKCAENAGKKTKIPRITIMHHPPESFVWEEVHGNDLSKGNAKNSMKYITDNSSLVISGHVHGLPRTMGYYDSAYLISNGTFFNEHLLMSFVMFSLNINTGELQLDKYKVIVEESEQSRTNETKTTSDNDKPLTKSAEMDTTVSKTDCYQDTADKANIRQTIKIERQPNEYQSFSVPLRRINREN